MSTSARSGRGRLGFDPRAKAADPDAEHVGPRSCARHRRTGDWAFVTRSRCSGRPLRVHVAAAVRPRGHPADQERDRPQPAGRLGRLDLATDPRASRSSSTRGGPVVGQLILRTIKGTLAFPGCDARRVEVRLVGVERRPAAAHRPDVRPNPGPQRWQAVVTTADPGTYSARMRSTPRATCRSRGPPVRDPDHPGTRCGRPGGPRPRSPRPDRAHVRRAGRPGGAGDEQQRAGDGGVGERHRGTRRTGRAGRPAGFDGHPSDRCAVPSPSTAWP